MINKCHYNPKRIFRLPDQLNTYVEIDLEEEWVLPEFNVFSKAKWTPFAGRKVKGAVKRVVLRGEVVFIDGRVSIIAHFHSNSRSNFMAIESRFQIIAQPGFGQDVRGSSDQSNFSIPHLEFSDLGDPRVTRTSISSTTSPGAGGGDDVHFHRHTSETRELYGQMFSELGIPKIRSMSVGPTSTASTRVDHPHHQPLQQQQPVDSAGSMSLRPTSPAPPRGLDNSILSPISQKNLSIRPISPIGPNTPSSSVTYSTASHMHGLIGQSILTVDMFSKEQLNAIFNLAQTFRLCVQKERSLDHILKV